MLKKIVMTFQLDEEIIINIITLVENASSLSF